MKPTILVCLVLILSACGQLRGIKDSFRQSSENEEPPPGDDGNNEEESTPLVKASGYEVTLQMPNGQRLRAQPNKEVAANGDGTSNLDKWILVDLNGGNLEHDDLVALQSYDLYYLVAELGGGDVVRANRTGVGPWETFQIVNLSGGRIFQNGDRIGVRSHAGQILSTATSGGQGLMADKTAIQSSETFVVNGQLGVDTVPCFFNVYTTDGEAAILSAATHVRNNYPQYFQAGTTRAEAYDMMTVIINILRHSGHPVARALANPGAPPSNPYRWGSDALSYQTPGGYETIDIYLSWPQPADPHLLHHGITTNYEITSDLVPIGYGRNCN